MLYKVGKYLCAPSLHIGRCFITDFVQEVCILPSNPEPLPNSNKLFPSSRKQHILSPQGSYIFFKMCLEKITNYTTSGGFGELEGSTHKVRPSDNMVAMAQRTCSNCVPPMKRGKRDWSTRF